MLVGRIHRARPQEIRGVVKTILQRVVEGDPTAVEACVDEYGGLAYRLAWRYLGRTPGDIEDAVQEVFVEIWMNAKRFDPERGSEPSFIATIIHRRLIDFQRRVSKQRSVQLNADSGGAGVFPGLPRPPESSEFSELSKAFESLPEDERSALWMAVRSGMSHSQIAAATQTPIGTVKTRLRRAMGRLSLALGASRGAERRDVEFTGRHQ